MKTMEQIRHLYSRAGFGLRFEDMRLVEQLSVKHSIDFLFRSSVQSKPLVSVKENVNYKDFLKDDQLSRKMFMMQQRQQEKDLNIEWLKNMSTGNTQLRDKMTLFWHNHFACRTLNAWYAQQLNNIQRDNALGNFRTLLLEVSKTPAMLQFLNNQQNRKGHPNENFAREVMELFTIGRGNYTEQDVKESARAFTGWGFNKDGVFAERKFLHDDGQKTFLGNTGNFTGEDIIDMLLAKKQTAHFICTKLYKYLVNEVPDAANVNAMADVFYNHKYEIKPLLEFVFNAKWFYNEKNTGNLIKSPVEFIVAMNRQFYIDYQNPDIQIQFQRALGQVLFYPPNVAGWPGGKNWIDSSSLMYRLSIPATVLNDGVIDFTGKTDPDDEAFIATARKEKKAVHTRVQTQPDWNKFLSDIPAHTTKKEIAQLVLSPAINSKLLSIINKATDIKTMVIELVSTPEYQLS
ncbi:DUF1800 domain-containing protein [Mucilaginibacter segetis]|uniref:DUF1800 domain-containing protein n=1 Tax=Mucilaginibacter segetis TaxID=2793071 RepID=A0A934PUR5_9SPHI|nr:DUF1800 domain-containing protein [Mucilaginibacter segetis]MBK0379755.1 DUF1800 domain-containing protein [Mucilaginibacter segetis]